MGSADRGFSLTELLITMVILLTLAAVAIPVYRNYTNDALTARGRAELESAANGARQFNHDVGNWPLADPPAAATSWVADPGVVSSQPPTPNPNLGLVTNPYATVDCALTANATNPYCLWRGPYLTVYPTGDSRMTVPGTPSAYYYDRAHLLSGTPNRYVIFLRSWGIDQTQNTTDAQLSSLSAAQGDDLVIYLRRPAP